MKKNLGENYHPLFFLASLGNGGMAVAFYLYLMFMVEHPGKPMSNFEHWFPVLTGDNIALAITVTIALAGILFFGFNHFRLLFWNLNEYKLFKQTTSFTNLKQSNGEVSFMTIPLTLAMSVNVVFIIAGVFVPGIWNIVEYLFPGALIAFLLIGVYAFRIFVRYFSRFSINGDFDFVSNNNLSQLISVFAFTMISVGFASSAAMSHVTATSVIGLMFSIFFASLAILLAGIKMILGFQSIFKHGIDKLGSPSVWIMIPILTLLGITYVRLYMGVNHNILHIKEPTLVPIMLVLFVLVSLQVIFGLFGYKVLKKIGYFEDFVHMNGAGKHPGSYSLICPGVAFFVLGMFFIHYGFVKTGIVAQYSIGYFLLLVPFLLIKWKTILTIFTLNKKLLRKTGNHQGDKVAKNM